MRLVTTETRKIAVYPNPATEFVKLDGIQPGDIRNVELVGLNGKTVYKAASVSANCINVAKMTPGTYVIKVTDKAGIISTQKVLIQK